MTSSTVTPTSEPVFSDPAVTAEFPYRALSRAAIVSVAFFFIALLGLMPPFEAMLGVALFGVLSGVYGLRTTRRYPAEYSGSLVAQIGLMLNAFLLVGGVSMHTYIYLTEVPEGYERVAFYELKMPENYADAPTVRAVELDGKDVFLKGYIHPASGSGKLNKFVLVPDLGTCCFGGEPRSSSMIEVTLPRGETVNGGLTRLKLAGRFEVNKYLSGANDFKNPAFYRLKADIVN